MLNGSLFPLLLPLVAFLYASTGHGGATAYLALMALLGMAPEVMKPAALTLNVFVAGIAFYMFYARGHFRWRLYLPFAIGSIPMAWLGGMLQIDPVIYRKLLAVFLALAALRILGVFGRLGEETRSAPFLPGVCVGAGIGFVSGLLGIGGGIVLSPVILLMRWGVAQEAAAVSALFITINSIAALGGLAVHGLDYPSGIPLWILLALAGGWAGSRFGSGALHIRIPRALLAAVMASACVKLLTA